MSDDPREAKRKMERILICNDIWWDCLPFLSRAKVGFEFALVSDRFDGLADAHLGSKKRPWTLCNLWIRREKGNATIANNYDTENKEHFPFPEASLPENVIGFKRIYICYVDEKVIDFLRQIRRLFEQSNDGNGIVLLLFIHSSQMRSWDVFFDAIWPLVNPSAITKLFLPWNNNLDEFCRRTSPTFLLDWANVRMLVTRFDVPFGNGENSQLLRQWLFTPREDGKPKLLQNYSDWDLQTVEQFKTEFLSAQNAVSFIIAIFVLANNAAVPFELDNWRTGERLTLRHVDGTAFWLLARGPIGGRDAVKWAKWEREAMGMEKQHNVLNIDFGDDNIGFLSPH